MPAAEKFRSTVDTPAETRSAPPPMVVRPEPPKDVQTPSDISATTTASIGSNPRPTRKGPAIAAGVPAPAAPSIKIGTKRPIRISCTLRSGEIAAIAPLTISIAPDCCIISRIRKEKKIRPTMKKALLRPDQVCAHTAEASPLMPSSEFMK